MSRPCYAVIKIAALQHNLKQVKKFAPHSRIVAMVKANAYGHGIQNVIKGLANCDSYGVASIDEACILRDLRVSQPIIIFDGFFTADELLPISYGNFSIVVHSAWQIEALEQIQMPQPISLWLKINSGMNRLGFMPQDISEIWHRLQNCSNVRKPIGLMTHFADADEASQISLTKQLTCFQQATAAFTGPRSLANSAAILSAAQTHADWVRPGIMLFGVSPFANTAGKELGLKPVMMLGSNLIALRVCKRGETVGYGGTYTCPEDRLIGIAAIGYGDGYPRHLKKDTPVLVNEGMAKIIGRVSMDMVSIDLHDHPDAKIGDPVILWGHDNLPVEIIADCAGTIAYELLCGVTSRVRFQQS